MDDDLCFTPAVELARLLRSRNLSARELLDAFLNRIHRVNPRLNAIVTLAEEQATAQAAAADEALARGGAPGVLHGLPIAVKDLADTAGIRTTIVAADEASGPPAYHIAADAAVTVLLYEHHTVKANYAFRTGELTEPARAAILAALAKMVSGK